MTTPDTAGNVLTVQGPVDPNDLGITITHEHLLIDMTVDPPDPSDKKWQCFVKQRFGEGKREVAQYANAGGGTIVDTSNIGIHRNPLALAELSRDTGVHIVMGGGYHFEPYHPEGFSSRSIDDIADEIIRDVQVGLDESGIRCGIIGEVGCSWPWTDVEKRSVSAAVAAQQTTGAPLLIHPGLDQKAPVEIAEFIDREGGDLTRTVMSHVDLRIAERSILHELAATGIYIEFDTFGFESAPQQPSPEPPTPTDPERIGMVEWLIEEEFTEQIVLAHDLYTRERRREFGGHGIQHIPTTVVDQMKLQGITQAQIDTMLIENPRRVLTFV